MISTKTLQENYKNKHTLEPDDEGDANYNWCHWKKFPGVG